MIATSHLTDEQFQSYKNRKIPLVDLFAIGDHLEGCRECREKLGGAEERAAILQALTFDLKAALLKSSEHLRYEQIECDVEGTSELSSPKTSLSKKLLQNKFGAILPFVIGITATILLLGFLLALITKLL